MAEGRVITGFSKPYFALYSATGTTVTYTQGQRFARGVSVEITAKSAETEPFYADNQAAETAPSVFVSGEAKLEVDGLLPGAETAVLGLPAAETNGLTAYGDGQTIPYVGFGVIIRYVSDGVESYEALILPKVRFSNPDTKAETQKEKISYQTQSLTAALLRDDTAGHNWKYRGRSVATEAAAEEEIKTFLRIAGIA